jgi:hypothetical protein
MSSETTEPLGICLQEYGYPHPVAFRSGPMSTSLGVGAAAVYATHSPSAAVPGSTRRSSLREVMSSFVNTLRKW